MLEIQLLLNTMFSGMIFPNSRVYLVFYVGNFMVEVVKRDEDYAVSLWEFDLDKYTDRYKGIALEENRLLWHVDGGLTTDSLQIATRKTWICTSKNQISSVFNYIYHLISTKMAEAILARSRVPEPEIFSLRHILEGYPRLDPPDGSQTDYLKNLLIPKSPSLPWIYEDDENGTMNAAHVPLSGTESIWLQWVDTTRAQVIHNSPTKKGKTVQFSFKDETIEQKKITLERMYLYVLAQGIIRKGNWYPYRHITQSFWTT